MEWLDIGAYLTLLTGIGTVWWRLNSRAVAVGAPRSPFSRDPDYPEAFVGL